MKGKVSHTDMRNPEQRINYGRRALITAVGGFFVAGGITGGVEIWRQNERHNHPQSTGLKDETLQVAYKAPSSLKEFQTYRDKVCLVSVNSIGFGAQESPTLVRLPDRQIAMFFGIQPEEKDDIFIDVYSYTADIEKPDGTGQQLAMCDLSGLALATPEESQKGKFRFVGGWDTNAKHTNVIDNWFNEKRPNNPDIQDSAFVGVYLNGRNVKMNTDMSFFLATHRATAMDIQNAEHIINS